MNILVVGYGSAGKRHAANVRALGHESIVTDRENGPILAATTDGFQTSIPDDGIDAAVIATPASEHGFNLRQIARIFPTARVLVEKPLGLAAHAFDGIPASVTARVSVAYNWRRHQLVRGLVAKVKADGLVWAPSVAAFWCRCDMRAWPGKTYADALLEMSHEIDLALALCGPATLLDAVNDGRGAWTLALQHESGTRSEVAIDGTSPVRERGCGVQIGDATAGYTVDYADPMEDTCIAASYRETLRAFLEDDGDTFHGLATFEDGLAVLRLCDEARKIAHFSRVRRLTHGDL